jgi:hypothetical protein
MSKAGDQPGSLAVAPLESRGPRRFLLLDALPVGREVK